MSCLNAANRPVVLFDATNLEHRRIYNEFRRTRTWGRSEIRFELEHEWSDIISMIESKLLKFYSTQEFA